jgi:hypothetical protein
LNKNNPNLVIFSKAEVNWLTRNKQLSKSFEYKIKYSIKKKINKLVSFELPLLIESGLIDKQLIERLFNNTNINNYMLPILGKEKVAGSNPAQGFSFAHYFHCLMRKNEFLCYQI